MPGPAGDYTLHHHPLKPSGSADQEGARYSPRKGIDKWKALRECPQLLPDISTSCQLKGIDHGRRPSSGAISLPVDGVGVPWIIHHELDFARWIS